MAMHCLADPSPHTKMIGALAVVAFFFLLRVAEYTPSNRTTRTVPLRKQDIKLWSNGSRLSNDADWVELSSADAVTITLENQKNGDKGSVLHHTASGDDIMCPVRAMTWILYAIRHADPTTPIGTFCHASGAIGRVTAKDMRLTLKQAATRDNLPARGFSIDRIGNHSLRSGGAVALKLAGYDSDIIKKLGRWSSNTYLLYIQSQIANLTTGIATQMGRRLTFYNVG